MEDTSRLLRLEQPGAASALYLREDKRAANNRGPGRSRPNAALMSKVQPQELAADADRRDRHPRRPPRGRELWPSVA